MDIKIPQIPCYSNNISNSKQVNRNNFYIQSDSFVPSFSSQPKDFKKGLWGRIKNFVGVDADKPIPEYSWTEAKPYHVELSKGIKSIMEEDIPPSNLHNIMTPQEIREVLPKLRQSMFESTEENIRNGIYCAELDYPSNFSDGKECATDILDRIAVIANDYKKKTGKDFIFAIADRDNMGGVQHAIRVIGENPQNYQNIKFIPAVKLTFAHEAPESKLKYENSEVIVYGINPYSDNLVNFTNNIIERRRNNILNFIRDIYQLYPEFAYNILEFAEQNKLKYYKDYGVSNLYWRAREYAQTKGDVTVKGVSVPPADVMEQAEEILDQLDVVLTGSTYKPPINKSTTIIDPDEKLNTDISNVFANYSTKKQSEQGLTSSFENSYQQIINCLNKEKYGNTPDSKPVIALSSPYYLSYCFEKFPQIPSYPNVTGFLNNLQEKSNGMLMAFESTSPQYVADKGIDAESLKKFNDFIRKNTTLFEVGGSLFNKTRNDNENN